MEKKKLNNINFSNSSQQDNSNPSTLYKDLLPSSLIKVTEEDIQNPAKVFKIKKHQKEDHEIDDIISEEEASDQGEKKDSRKRVSAFSKVNFTKLKNEEKDERLQNLSRLVKRLRRKVKNLESKFKTDTNKLLSKYIANSLGINKKKKPNSNENLELDVDKICKAINILRSYDNFEYDDEKHIIENLINLLAEDKLPLDSINFRKICTQLRMFTPDDKIEYVNKHGKKITFAFPEKDVHITSKEYEYYSQFNEREDVIRMILGLNEENQKNQEKTKNTNNNEPKNLGYLESANSQKKGNLDFSLDKNLGQGENKNTGNIQNQSFKNAMGDIFSGNENLGFDKIFNNNFK